MTENMTQEIEQNSSIWRKWETLASDDKQN